MWRCDITLQMLQLDASKRPSLKEVVAHPWLQELAGPPLPTPTAAQVRAAKEAAEAAAIAAAAVGAGAGTGAGAGAGPAVAPTPTPAASAGAADAVVGGVGAPEGAGETAVHPPAAPVLTLPTGAGLGMAAPAGVLSPRGGMSGSNKVAGGPGVGSACATPKAAGPAAPRATPASQTRTGAARATPAPTPVL